MKGRKPKPTEQRRREGNARQHTPPQPVLVGGRPSEDDFVPPARLSATEREWWNLIVPKLAEVGIADLVDLPVIEQMAVQYGRIRQAQRRIKRDGIFSRGSTYQLVEHPALKIEREATRLLLALCEQYGLTAVARTRLGLAELQRRSLSQEMERELGKPNLRPVGVASVSDS